MQRRWRGSSTMALAMRLRLVERRLRLRLLRWSRLRSSWRDARGGNASARANVQLKMLVMMVLLACSPLMTSRMAGCLMRQRKVRRHCVLLLPRLGGQYVTRASVLRLRPRRPRLRSVAGGDSAVDPRKACRPQLSREEHGRLSALADTLRAELLSKGVSADELVSRCLPFREDHLPSFPVIKSGVWAQLSPDSLAAAVVSVMRDTNVPAFDGLWKAVVKGSYHFRLPSS